MTKPYLNEDEEWCIKDDGEEIVFMSYEEAWEYYDEHQND